MARGRLITIEGLDGAGKTTLAAELERALAGRVGAVRVLREPGGVELAERIRTLVTDPELRVGARAEALLYAAARAQLVEGALETLLDSGVWVLLARFVDSSLAYQGAGRELGIEAVRAINDFATGGLQPDRTLLLRVDPAAGRAPAGGGGGGAAPPPRPEAEPDRIRVLDASAEPDAVLAAALAALEDLLPAER